MERKLGFIKAKLDHTELYDSYMVISENYAGFQEYVAFFVDNEMKNIIYGKSKEVYKKVEKRGQWIKREDNTINFLAGKIRVRTYTREIVFADGEKMVLVQNVIEIEMKNFPKMGIYSIRF